MATNFDSTSKGTTFTVTITAEHVLYLGILLFALVLRVWNLGTVPLDGAESAIAVQSWLMSEGSTASIRGSPLLIYVNSFVFLIFGASDASARGFPALVGSLLPVLPYFGRSILGRNNALAAAILLAFSPTLVHFSRYVGEPVVVAALSLGLVFCFVRWLKSRVASFFYASAALLALMLSSGASGYLNALLFVAFILAVALRGSRDGQSSNDGDGPSKRLAYLASFWPGEARVRNWIMLFGATLLIALTGGLSNLSGVQEGIIDELSLSLSQTFTAAGSPPFVPLLLIYETLIIVFAAINVMGFSGRMGLFSWFLVWWVGASLVLFPFVSGRSVDLAVQPLVPLILLAAQLIGNLFDWFVRERPFASLGVLAIATLPPLLVFGYVLNMAAMPGQNDLWPIAGLPLIVLVLAIVGSLYWRGLAYAAPRWGLLGLIVLFATMIHTMANLSFQPEANPAELLRQKTTTADVRNLAADVSDVLAGAPGIGMKGAVVVEGPYSDVLMWYLRKEDPKFTPMANEKPLIVVGGSDVALPPGEWARQQYSIGASSSLHVLSPLRVGALGQWWRWLIYREGPLPSKYESVTMYVSI